MIQGCHKLLQLHVSYCTVFSDILTDVEHYVSSYREYSLLYVRLLYLWSVSITYRHTHMYRLGLVLSALTGDWQFLKH